MNLPTYEFHFKMGYLLIIVRLIQNGIDFQQLASAEYKELNLKKSSVWKDAKNNGKKMWELIDWSSKAEIKKDVLIQENNADLYFKNIFQSEKTREHPTIGNVNDELNTYYMYVPLMDDIPQKTELDKAQKKLARVMG